MQKQADDRMWLIFTTVWDAVSFIGAAAGIVQDGPKALENYGQSVKTLTADIISLAEPPAAVKIVEVLKDTSPQGAASAWGQVRSSNGPQSDGLLQLQSTLNLCFRQEPVQLLPGSH